ncbi:hypothetical protein [Gimesia algae]|uniref:Uncharacterized protein n=1 Tax=Gimesia algae TaxID=2527971 RepID=A0A517VHQ5_9PLAN|nr:hypothetical protein [Gimesia algae]QDT92492.1 hypothetical protein Pan161_41590 [Gimesia algae]
MKKHVVLFSILPTLVIIMYACSLLRPDFEQGWSGQRYLLGGKTSALPDEFSIESTLPSGLTVTAKYGLMQSHTPDGIVSQEDQRYEYVQVTGRNWFWRLPDYGTTIRQQSEAELDLHLKQLGVAAISGDQFSQNILAMSKRNQCSSNTP